MPVKKMKKKMSRRLTMLIASVTFMAIFIFSAYYFFRSAPHVAGVKMAQDIEMLSSIFQKIDETCGIIDFDHEKNPINFLNVEKFVGSEVGSMNLANPQHWKGPYVNDNPTIQDIEYQVVKTKKGYFITPGELIVWKGGVVSSVGVTLPNGKKIGKDIMLDENSDIQAMMNDENMLMYKGKPLAASIKGPEVKSADNKEGEEIELIEKLPTNM